VNATYSDQVLDHFHHPRNVGEIENPTIVVETVNPACGDLMKLWARVEDGVIVDVKFKVAGCVPAVACGSWLTERIKGALLDRLTPIASDQVADGLGGLPAASRHAAVLASDALRELLARLLQPQNGIGP
jgi:nitrogen fixation protein NifU and related proteins